MPTLTVYHDSAKITVRMTDISYIYKRASVIETAYKSNEPVYTIHAIDTDVDETMFDISGYQVVEGEFSDVRVLCVQDSILGLQGMNRFQL
ncbi:MAG: hypothetical protein IKG19_00525 [Lachnospiraceae bacterium]|nr:hypothetical protein [Lachnospiraceae bacterium]